ncbi:MAG: MFS transporter [Candidatus Bathyarchaeota archaeon]|nr:MFS transporter [Candidatus Bathyarchaeota archaeon]
MNERWAAVINLSVVSALVFLGVNVVSPILPQYAMTFNVPVALTGWAISSYALARVLADLPAGMFSDKYGRKKVMVTGLAIVTVSSVVAGLAPTYLVLILARALGGLGSALYVTCATSWLAYISHGPNRGKMMSMYSTMVFMGMSAGPAVGGFVAAYYGIQAPFYVYALLTAVGVVATIPLREISGNDVQTRSLRWSDLKTVFSSRSFILVNFSVFALFFLMSSVRSTLIPLYASINLGLGEDQIGLLMTVTMIATGLLSFPSGWLSDRVGRKIPIMTCIFSSAFLVLLVPFQSDMKSLLTFMVAYGFATGLQGSISAWPADVASPDKMGTAMGVYRLIGDLGFFLGPITVTYASDYFNPNLITFQPFLIPSIIATVAGIILIKADDPSRRAPKIAEV